MTGPSSPIAAEKVLLTVEEVAARLSLGRTSVYGLLKHGKIESVRIGRARRVPVWALKLYAERLLAEQSEVVGSLT